MHDYTLVRSRRKTVSIHITKDAKAEVRAPLKTSKALIDEFVASKSRWIEDQLARRRSLNAEKTAFSPGYGDSIAFCGKTYVILASDQGCLGFDDRSLHIPAGLDGDALKYAVAREYKTAAKLVITEKVSRYARLMKVEPKSVRINEAKTRWGSCSGKNALNFSWRLVMADDGAIDYVVVHELAHITEHNHSPRFWAIVERVLPDYKTRRLALKALQDKLSREDWG